MSAVLSTISPHASALLSKMPHKLWRGNQMASFQAPSVPTGYAVLDRQLPQGGWPASVLIELLLQQPGVGEMRLLRPALATLSRKRRIALVQPPYLPQTAAWIEWGLPSEQLLWVKATRTADALWSAEQILRNGSCGALLLWQNQVRAESLRRLHLAAQAADILLWVLRPLAAAQDASPAPLRIGLRPGAGALVLDLIKRQGPRCGDPLFLPLDGVPAASPTLVPAHHAFVDRHSFAAIGSGNLAPTLV